MPEPSFFARFGVFVRERLLDEAGCAALRAEIRRVGRDAAAVRRPGREDAVDTEVRDTHWAGVDAATEQAIEARIAEIVPEIAASFDIGVQGIRGLQFLVYEPGGFFRPHADNSAEAADAPRARKISVVLFLNDGGAEEVESPGDTFAGGALTFYGLLGGEGSKGLGLPMQPRAGTLIAFRSEIVHGVEPVTEGERYTVVCWLY